MKAGSDIEPGNIMTSMDYSTLLVVLTVIMMTLMRRSESQGTIKSSSCTINGDDSNIYTIQINTSPQESQCEDVSPLREQLKDAELRYTEFESDILQLQDIVKQLQETNSRLSVTVSNLEADMKAMQNNTDSGKEAGSEEEEVIVAAKCPETYHTTNEDFSSCYMFVNWYLTWYEAETYCMGSGGHLISLETRGEEDYIIQQIKQRAGFAGANVWTGANDIANEAKWTWVGSNTPVNHTTWMLYQHPEHGPIQQPDNHQDQEHCMDLFHADNYQWNDQACVHEYYCICEYKLM